MDENDSNIQELLSADVDPIIVNVQREKQTQKKKVPTVILVLVVISMLLVVIIGARKTNAGERIETYRGICWGMTKDEVKDLETRLGNVMIDASDDGNWVKYTLRDLVDSGDDTNNNCVYTFDEQTGKISSFVIGSSNDGGNLFTFVGADLVDMYGEGEYGSTSGDGLFFLNADWNNEHETIKGILFYSTLCNEAYFTFTYNDGTEES